MKSQKISKWYSRVEVRSAIVTAFGALIAAIISGIISFLGTGDVKEKEFKISLSQVQTPFIYALKDSSLDQKNAELLYEGATGIKREDPEFLGKLRGSLVELNLLLTKDELPDTLDSQANKKWGEHVRTLIENLEKVSPYQGLPSAERRIFNELNGKVENQEILNNLDELSALILARTEELDETRSQARYSFVFAIAGVVGTVVSILISIFQFRQKFNIDLNKEQNG